MKEVVGPKEFDPQILRDILETELRRDPFPTNECRRLHVSPELHTALTTYIADIAGIASHGRKLATLDPPRRRQFKQYVAKGFWQRHPAAAEAITAEKTPKLHQLLIDTEEARLLIVQYLGD
jgi:hypothetical protein